MFQSVSFHLCLFLSYTVFTLLSHPSSVYIVGA
jgi:hypothetical protein